MTKKQIQSLSLKKLSLKGETLFGSLKYLFFKGTEYYCNVCKKSLKKFSEPKPGEKKCPYCGSLSRHRRLWNLLVSEYIDAQDQIFHLSPSASLKRNLEKIPDIYYISSDYVKDMGIENQEDLIKINSVDNTYNLIICCHILEHIINDELAIRELYRILKPGGHCIIQTPIKEGHTYEDPTISTPKGREQAYGQKDHVRIYSLNDLIEKLEKNGLEVERLEFKSDQNNRFGYKEYEYILIGKKQTI